MNDATAISAADVKELRERTGAPIMDCKAALAEAEGDMDKAIEVLRVRGQASAAKRSGRSTTIVRRTGGAGGGAAGAAVAAAGAAPTPVPPSAGPVSAGSCGAR